MKYDQRVDAYIANAQPFARPILNKVRERIHAVAPDVEEAIKWSAPGFMLGGKILLVIAAFKAHVALNFWRGRELGNGQPKAGAMGQFGRLTSLLDLPSDDELDTLIREAVALAKFPPGPRKRKHAPKPPAQMPPDFAAALDEAPSAKNVLDNFPPGSRREYLDWIGEAKQEATRAKRIATAIEWLSEGKRRNWKYENC